MLFYRSLTLFLIAVFLLVSGCKSFQKAFVPEKKKGSDAFLVKKKSPLVIPKGAIIIDNNGSFRSTLNQINNSIKKLKI